MRTAERSQATRLPPQEMHNVEVSIHHNPLRQAFAVSGADVMRRKRMERLSPESFPSDEAQRTH